MLSKYLTNDVILGKLDITPVTSCLI
jgi:hypothetical protein